MISFLKLKMSRTLMTMNQQYMVSKHFIGRKAKLRHEADIKYILCTMNHVSICHLPEAKCEDRPAQNTGTKIDQRGRINPNL